MYIIYSGGTPRFGDVGSNSGKTASGSGKGKSTGKAKEGCDFGISQPSDHLACSLHLIATKLEQLKVFKGFK